MFFVLEPLSPTFTVLAPTLIAIFSYAFHYKSEVQYRKHKHFVLVVIKFEPSKNAYIEQKKKRPGRAVFLLVISHYFFSLV